jgi:D-3-phosphoglycerate dehydrogenase
MRQRCAILDDYQNVTLKLGDWAPVSHDVDVKVFTKASGNQSQVIEALRDFPIVCAMRERTPFPRAVFEALPNLKLLITTGMRNASIDLAAAHERGVIVCGTAAVGQPTAELAFGLILDLARNISHENARLKAGEPWQETIGIDLAGRTLGILGLGKLGARVARFGKAFGMRVIAWSQNLTPEKCKEAGAEHVSKEELFRRSDFLSIHLVLSARSRGLVGSAELALMKPTAFLVNTSRGPIVDEAALIDTLRNRRIGGAGLDVFDTEPLPADHPLRKLPNVVLTPHLGYVTEDNYRAYFKDMVADIRGFLDGKPVNVLSIAR